MPKEMNESVRKQVAANLREFGYDVTDETVSGEIDSLLAGEHPKNIIAMFTESQLKKNGYLA